LLLCGNGTGCRRRKSEHYDEDWVRWSTPMEREH
jgi:hypothetical protein